MSSTQRRVFISYDTHEKDWAIFLKGVLDRRFPGVVATFVAYESLRLGDSSVAIMLSELRTADAVIPLCSHQSKSSPWLWFEMGSVWGRGVDDAARRVWPLFLGGIGGNEFGPPLALIAQGKPFDAAGVSEVVTNVAALLQQGPAAPLEAGELDELSKLVAAFAQSPFDLVLGSDSCVQDLPDVNLRRIRLVNLSARTISAVEVKLRRITPGNPSWLPAPLQRTHLDPHPLDLHEGTETTFDLIWWIPSQNSFFLGVGSNVQASKALAVGSYVLEVSASGRDVRTQVRRFEAGLDATNSKLVLSAVS